MQTEVPASDGEILTGWGVISRSPHGKINVMLDSVVTKEAHLDIFCDNTHSNNTSEPTAKIEALSTPANWHCFNLQQCQETSNFLVVFLKARALKCARLGSRVVV